MVIVQYLACRADQAREQNNNHQHDVHRQIPIAHGKGIVAKKKHCDNDHAGQRAHPNRVSAYFREDIDKKTDKQSNGSTQHKSSVSRRHLRIAIKISEHPQVENARDDIRSNALFVVLQIKRGDKARGAKHRYGYDRDKKSG